MIITVAGENEVRLSPERGTVRMSVTFEGDDRAEVADRTRSLGNEVLAHLKRREAADRSAVARVVVDAIRTSSWHPYNDKGEPLPLRHRALIPVEVEFSDFVALTDFAQHWGEREGVTIDGVEWALTDATRRAHTDAVLTAAVEDARSRAQVMAQAAGAGDVEFVDLADPGMLGLPERPIPAAAMMRSAKMDAGGVELAPADIVIRAEVHARFQA